MKQSLVLVICLALQLIFAFPNDRTAEDFNEEDSERRPREKKCGILNSPCNSPDDAPCCEKCYKCHCKFGEPLSSCSCQFKNDSCATGRGMDDYEKLLNN
nr:venom gland protein U11-PHTX-Pmx1a [Physocyclus mexicanus]